MISRRRGCARRSRARAAGGGAKSSRAQVGEHALADPARQVRLRAAEAPKPTSAASEERDDDPGQPAPRSPGTDARRRSRAWRGSGGRAPTSVCREQRDDARADRARRYGRTSRDEQAPSRRTWSAATTSSCDARPPAARSDAGGAHAAARPSARVLARATNARLEQAVLVDPAVDRAASRAARRACRARRCGRRRGRRSRRRARSSRAGGR